MKLTVFANAGTMAIVAVTISVENSRFILRIRFHPIRNMPQYSIGSSAAQGNRGTCSISTPRESGIDGVHPLLTLVSVVGAGAR